MLVSGTLRVISNILMPYDNPNKAKRDVVVLLDQEDRHQEICNTVHNPLSALCRMLTLAELQSMQNEPARVLFTYTTMGLYVNDPKIDEYLAQCDGVIVLARGTPDRVPELTSRIQRIKRRPLMVLISDVSLPTKQPVWGDACYGQRSTVTQSHTQSAVPLNSTSRDFLVYYTASDGSICYDANVSKTADGQFGGPVTYRRDTVFETFATLLDEYERPKAPEITSVTIPTKDLVERFERATLPITIWDHYGRLRVVFTALKMYGYNDTINTQGWLCRNWRHYKTTIGHGNLWNYSLTRMWIEHLNAIIKSNPQLPFERVWEKYVYIQNGSFHKYHYSNIIFSAAAKESWVQPDLKPLPSAGAGASPMSGYTCVVS